MPGLSEPRKTVSFVSLQLSLTTCAPQAPQVTLAITLRELQEHAQ
jgi:hypothetical protein